MRTMACSAPPLWRHQEEAVAFVNERRASLLHMGLGTGKSRVAIESAAQTDARRVLILCPLSVIPAWEEQFRRFGSGWEVIPLRKHSVRRKTQGATEGLALARAKGLPAVIIINYESARNAPFAPFAMSAGFDLLILDESHRIKSPSGATSRWVSRLAQRVKRRIALTGTPMPHSPLDIYAQFRSLDPALFGWSFVRFRRKYAQMGGYGGHQVLGYQSLDELRERMSRITFQAGREVLDLPPAIHEHRLVDMCAQGRRAYDELDRDFRTRVKEGEVTAANALVKLLRLQQLTSGSVTIDEDPPEVVQVDTSKQDALQDLLQDLPETEPVVVFGRFISDLRTVHKAAAALDRASLELSGRKKELEDWQSGAAPILAVQIQAGGVGIDLTRSCYVVYLSTGFSLGDYEQSLARAHRPGQTRTTFYFHILARGTVDEQVYGALRKRRNIVESVLAHIHRSEEA